MEKWKLWKLVTVIKLPFFEIEKVLPEIQQ